MMGWAFVEQTKTHPNVWVQIAAVVLFFYGMMKLTAKASSKSEDNKTRKTQDDVE